MVNDELNHFKEKAIIEARRLFWIFAYLWILLSLFALHKAMILSEQDLFYHQGFAVINALVLAKIMFVVLMPFFALREIGRDIDDDKLFEQFFVRRNPATFFEVEKAYE
jgi:hypothetical protein